MARVLSYARVPLHRIQEDILRMVIVCGCALALIAAGQALPL